MYRNDSIGSPSANDDDAAVIAATAATVVPVSELNAENRAALCRSASVVHVQRAETINPANAHRYAVFLVEGTLALYNGREEVGTLDAKHPDARKALFPDKNAYQSARPTTLAKLVRFGREQLTILLREQQRNAIEVIDTELDELDNIVLDDLATAFADNRAVLLPLEADARALATACRREVASMPDLAMLLSNDPAAAVRLVHAANHAETAGSEPAETIRGALSRLGVDNSRSLITKFAEGPTLVPANPVIDDRARRYMQRTRLGCAIVQVLADRLPELKIDVATLVALASDIGELLLLNVVNEHADRFDDPQRLAATIERLRTAVSGWLISAWQLPPHCLDAAHVARDWYRNHSGEIGYTDLVTASHLVINAEVPDVAESSIPAANNLLLARRLQQAGIDLTTPQAILRAATSRIAGSPAMRKAS